MLDILAIAPHPDDCEIAIGGALARFKHEGLKVGACALTQGERGTYGSPELRERASVAAAEVLGLDLRETLDLPDGNVENTEENRLKLARLLRLQQPRQVFSFMPDTRHPDHGHCGQLVRESIFLAGVARFEAGGEPFRPEGFVMFPELQLPRPPDFVVDITDHWETKVKAIQAYGSQVHVDGIDDDNPNPADEARKTLIKSKKFWRILEARATLCGAMIDVAYGEPFYTNAPLRLNNPVGHLFQH